MAILRFHPARLFTRAVDGAFGMVELPALLMRPGLYAQAGCLRLRQAMGERMFVFDNGILVAVDSTEAGETLAAALTRLTHRNDPRVDNAVHAVRRRSLRLAEGLAGALGDKALAERALCAQAARIIEGVIAGGPAMAWFVRGARVRAHVDLQAFDAVWRAVLALWPEVDRFALGRHVQATGWRAVDTAEPTMRAAGAPKSLVALAQARTAPAEHDLAQLGALVLCGLVQSQAGPFTLEAVGVSEARRRGESSRVARPARAPRRGSLLALLAAAVIMIIAALAVGRRLLSPWWPQEAPATREAD
ncbi:MAG: hypothetical protein HYZ27_11095 [Deltaproteobacteria bacterium]|nr:hypothetical protein [Deltaproteobacteria bacterium]